MARPYQDAARFWTLFPFDIPFSRRRSLMARIVMKFGGTSMAGIERIRHVAATVKREAERGNDEKCSHGVTPCRGCCPVVQRRGIERHVFLDGPL